MNISLDRLQSVPEQGLMVQREIACAVGERQYTIPTCQPRRAGLAAAMAVWVGALTHAGCAPDDRAAADTPGGTRLERPTGEVRRNRIAVMPFNVSGAESALGYLESALPDLLSQKLSTRERPGAVLDATDLASARRQALDDGAGAVVIGAVVGNPDRMTIQTTLRLTRSGRVIAEESVTGELDSLDALASRLALQLVLWGVDPAARELIRSTPPPVIDATLSGFVSRRQLDWGDAEAAFEAALALDSTFGIAVEGLYDLANNNWYGGSIDRDEVDRLAWSLRHRSTAAHRAWMELSRGTDTTRRAGLVERIRDWEAGAAAYPNHAGIWNRLASLYFLDGMYAGVEDWDRRALQAWERGAEMPDFIVPCRDYRHLLLRGLEPGPSVVSAHAESCGPGIPFERLQMAAILGDTAELRRIRSSTAMDSIGPGHRVFPQSFVLTGHGLKEWRAALDGYERIAFAEDEWVVAKLARVQLARVAGRPREAGGSWREWLASGRSVERGGDPGDLWFALSLPIVSALIEPGWDEIAAEAGYRMVNPDPSWPDTLQEGPDSGRRRRTSSYNNSRDRLCYAEMARLVQGDTSQTRASVATLRDLRESTVPRPEYACPELLDAVREGLAFGPQSQALTRLDSVMSLAPTNRLDQSVTNLVLARLYWARGRVDEAWEWVRRRAWYRETGYLFPAWLRSEGQFAAAVGEREDAIRAYRHYLVLREDPEPALVPQRDSVLAELACLDPELADRRDPAVCAGLP